MLYNGMQRKQMQINEQPKAVMDISEISVYLGIGKTKIHQLIKARKIPASKIGKQYRFLKSVIDEWLKKAIIKKGVQS